MIRKFQRQDLEAAVKIWLAANKEAHDFIDPCYWEGYKDAVKEMFLQAEIYVFEIEDMMEEIFDETGGILGFIGLDKDYVEGIFVRGDVRSQSIGKQLLDLMLPGIPGEEVLRDIRKKGNTPVIILTAKDTIDDKVEFLRGGADDYVTKPFDIKEVTARVEVQIRRAETTGRKEEEHRFTYQELELNKGDFTVKVGNTELPHITKQEFSILELLLKHPKKVFSKEEMFEYAWEEQYMGETKTLDVHISNIRKKIKAVTDKEYIETVWGIGYRLHP